MYYSAYQQKVICLPSSLPKKKKATQKPAKIRQWGILKGSLDWFLVKTVDCPAREIRLNNCNPLLHHDSKNSQLLLDLSNSFVSLRNQTFLSTFKVTEYTDWPCWKQLFCIISLPMYSSSQVLCTESPQNYIHCLIDSRGYAVAHENRISILLF